MKSYQFDKTLNAYMEDGKNKTELPGQAEVSWLIWSYKAKENMFTTRTYICLFSVPQNDTTICQSKPL